MNVSRVFAHVIDRDRPGGSSRAAPTAPKFQATLAGEVASAPASTEQGTPSIAPRGTPNNKLVPGQLVELGGGVFYNTGNRTYQDLAGSIVATDPAAVQQYTDPETFLAGGAAYQASDAQLRKTVPNLDALVPPGAGSPTYILNARWAYEKVYGAPPVTVAGTPAWEHQASPVPLAAFPGVLKAPGPPPLAGTIPPPWDYALDRKQDA